MEQGLYLWYDAHTVQAEEPMAVNGDYTLKALWVTGGLFYYMLQIGLAPVYVVVII